MHSRIYQLSTERLPQEEWLTESDISTSDMDHECIDYVQECPGRRDEFLKQFVNVLPEDVFKVKGDTITIVADPAVLWDRYKAELISLLENMEFKDEEYDKKSWLGLGEYYLCRRAQKMIDIDSLFYIMDWTDCLAKSNSLVSYAHHLWEDGVRTIYICGILDYHF